MTDTGTGKRTTSARDSGSLFDVRTAEARAIAEAILGVGLVGYDPSREPVAPLDMLHGCEEWGARLSWLVLQLLPALAALQRIVEADDRKQEAKRSGQHSSITRWIPAEQAIEDARSLLVTRSVRLEGASQSSDPGVGG